MNALQRTLLSIRRKFCPLRIARDAQRKPMAERRVHNSTDRLRYRDADTELVEGTK